MARINSCYIIALSEFRAIGKLCVECAESILQSNQTEIVRYKTNI